MRSLFTVSLFIAAQIPFYAWIVLLKISRFPENGWKIWSHTITGLVYAAYLQWMKKQNLMYKSTAITYELYSGMNAGNTNEIITTLGFDTSSQKSVPAETIPENLPDYIKIAIQALIDSAKP